MAHFGVLICNPLDSPLVATSPDGFPPSHGTIRLGACFHVKTMPIGNEAGLDFALLAKQCGDRYMETHG